MSQKNADTRQAATKKEYTIDSGFKGLFSEMPPEQYAELKASIIREGIRDDLVVGEWEGKSILLDGHTRDRICDDLKITDIPICRLSFPGSHEAKMWVLQNQFTRRNMTPFQRIEVALQFEDHYTKQAKDNREKGVSLNSSKRVVVVEEIANLAKTSPDTVKKVRKILGRKNVPKIAEAINALRRDDDSVSIHSVSEMIQKMDEAENPTDSKKTKPKPVKKASSQEIEKKMNNSISSLDRFEKNLSQKNDRIYFYDRVIKWAKAKKQAKKQKKQSSQ